MPTQTLHRSPRLTFGISHCISKELLRPVRNSSILINFKTLKPRRTILCPIDEIQPALLACQLFICNEELQASEDVLRVGLDEELHVTLTSNFSHQLREPDLGPWVKVDLRLFGNDRSALWHEVRENEHWQDLRNTKSDVHYVCPTPLAFNHNFEIP